jgi:hypothetical protein
MKTTLLELVAFALIAYGCWLAWAPLGFIVGGALLALVGYLAGAGADS